MPSSPRCSSVLTLSGSLGCAAIGELFRDPEDTVAPLTRPDPIYEALSDRYVELCAVSQYRPLEGDLGGIPGHAVMYLKGACRDESAPYPRLRPCRYATFDRTDPEHGAGISVNRWFKNVNWVATPGKFLFYNGEVAEYELLDQDRFDADGATRPRPGDVPGRRGAYEAGRRRSPVDSRLRGPGLHRHGLRRCASAGPSSAPGCPCPPR